MISLGNLVNMFLSDVFLYRENIFQMAWCNINLHRFKFLGHLVCLYQYCLYPTNATFFWQFFMICVKFTVAATFHFRYQNGAMVSDSFAYRKTKSCRQHDLYVLGLTFEEYCLRVPSRNRERCNKIICNITIYKTLKISELKTLKLPLSDWNT